MNRRHRILAIAIAVVALAGAAQLPVEHVRRTSPDGQFVVVSHSDAWRSALPMMPGSGSDKPGVAMLCTADG